jgi:two-component system, NarL family, response regulator NreC
MSLSGPHVGDVDVPASRECRAFMGIRPAGKRSSDGSRAKVDEWHPNFLIVATSPLTYSWDDSAVGPETELVERWTRAGVVRAAVMSIRVFVADDHGILRGGLRSLINAQADMEVVGEAANGPDAESGVKETEPDVVLMDISMPRGGGLAAIAAIKSVRPRTRILVLTVHDEVGYVRAAADAGAIGYVVKSAVDTELLAAIRAVAEGRTFMDVSVGLGLAEHTMSRRPSAMPGGREKAQLTEREREVMGRVAEGYTNSQIAEELQLGVKSVETYRARVMEKLGLESRADLVRFALESGILAPGKSA